MNKKTGIFIILFLLILIGIGIYIFARNNNTNSSNYEANKTSVENNVKNENVEQNNTTNNTEQNEVSNDNTTNSTTSENTTNTNSEKAKTPIEEQLSTFTTNIYSKDSSRQNNIKITCSTLNGTIVKNGATFSFCNTVGPSTSSKGYQKADIYDHNGNKKKGYGGGNCQISSTLYNAVLANPNLQVVERHPHSNHVPYVKKDKDAAVAYGSYDFKFKNNTGNDIKILASTDGATVTTTINIIK